MPVNTHHVANTLLNDFPARKGSLQGLREVEHVEDGGAIRLLSELLWSCCARHWEDKVHEVLDNAVVERMKKGYDPQAIPIQVGQVLWNQAHALRAGQLDIEICRLCSSAQVVDKNVCILYMCSAWLFKPARPQHESEK